MSNFFNSLPNWGKIVAGVLIGLLISFGILNITVPTQESLVKVKFIVQTKEKTAIEGVEVKFIFDGSPAPRMTNTDGYVEIDIPERNDIRIILRKDGYNTIDRIINLKADKQKTITYEMKKIPSSDQSSDYQNQFVQKQREKMDSLIDEWRPLRIDQKDIKNRILEDSIIVAEDMSKANEQFLTPISKVRKHYYISYGYFLASDLECDLKKSQIYNKKSLEHGENALTLINEIKNNPTDLRFSKIHDSDKKRIGNAIHHLLSLIYIIQIKSNPDDNNTEAIMKAEEYLKLISSEYKKNNFYRIKTNRYISPFLCIYNSNQADQDKINCSEFSSFDKVNFCKNLTNIYYMNNFSKNTNQNLMSRTPIQ